VVLLLVRAVVVGGAGVLLGAAELSTLDVGAVVAGVGVVVAV
jgi:hypothetical protein